MGFFDKKREEAMEQAAAMQQAAMSQQGAGMQPAGMPQMPGAMPNMGGMDMQSMMAEQGRLNRIGQSGVPGVATVSAARTLGAGMSGTKMEFDLAVSEGPGAPSTITVHQEMVGDSAWYQPGSRVKIKIDPSNSSDALLVGIAE